MTEPDATVPPPIHRAALDHLDGVRLPSAVSRQAGNVRLHLVGPDAPHAGELMGGPAHLLDSLEALHRRIWRERLPRPGRPGVFSEGLAQVLVDAYAAELSAAGIGRHLRLPLVFTPEQPHPELPGLRLSIRLALEPESGRGRVVTAFLVDPA